VFVGFEVHRYFSSFFDIFLCCVVDEIGYSLVLSFVNFFIISGRNITNIVEAVRVTNKSFVKCSKYFFINPVQYVAWSYMESLLLDAAD